MREQGPFWVWGPWPTPPRLAKNGLATYYVLKPPDQLLQRLRQTAAPSAPSGGSPRTRGPICSRPPRPRPWPAEHPDLDLAELHIVGLLPPPSWAWTTTASCSPPWPPPGPGHHPQGLHPGGDRPFRPPGGHLHRPGLRAPHGRRPGGHARGVGPRCSHPRVRAELCPSKTSGERWLAISGQAHALGLPTNATNALRAHRDPPAERVEHLLALRGQQDQSGGFSAFIPPGLPPREHRPVTSCSAPPGLDDLRVVAASRLLLDNFPHIKGLLGDAGGPKLAQVALNFGADDLDGTIVEERITHTPPGPPPPRA